jgi:predicted nucleotidyltransferase
LVAGASERQWERELAEQTRLEDAHERFQRGQPQAFSAAKIAAIRLLANDMPALWQSATQEERQTIVRLLAAGAKLVHAGAAEITALHAILATLMPLRRRPPRSDTVQNHEGPIMKVKKDETLAGVRLIKVRDFLRLHEESFPAEAIGEFFKVSDGRKQEIGEALVRAGYVAPHKSDKTRYLITPLGLQLCNAKFIQRISREKAEALLQSFLDRVASINERDELTHKVTAVRVFGDYLTDQADLSDIELAVAIKPRRESHVKESKERADQSGKTFRRIVDRITFGRSEVGRLLKDRNPYLSIHESDEVDKLGTPCKVLFSQTMRPINSSGTAQTRHLTTPRKTRSS